MLKPFNTRCACGVRPFELNSSHRHPQERRLIIHVLYKYDIICINGTMVVHNPEKIFPWMYQQEQTKSYPKSTDLGIKVCELLFLPLYILCYIIIYSQKYPCSWGNHQCQTLAFILLNDRCLTTPWFWLAPSKARWKSSSAEMTPQRRSGDCIIYIPKNCGYLVILWPTELHLSLESLATSLFSILFSTSILSRLQFHAKEITSAKGTNETWWTQLYHLCPYSLTFCNHILRILNVWTHKE